MNLYKFSFCFIFQIKTNDDLPKKLCSDCDRKLSDWQDFSTTCKKTQETLRKLLTSSSSKSEINTKQLPRQKKKVRNRPRNNEKVIEIKKETTTVDSMCNKICPETFSVKNLREDGEKTPQDELNIKDSNREITDIEINEIAQLIGIQEGKERVNVHNNAEKQQFLSSIDLNSHNNGKANTSTSSELQHYGLMSSHSDGTEQTSGSTVQGETIPDLAPLSNANNSSLSFGSSKFQVTDLNTNCTGTDELQVTITQDTIDVVQRTDGASIQKCVDPNTSSNNSAVSTNVSSDQANGSPDDEKRKDNEEYECRFCSKKFAQKTKWKNHLKVHSLGYQCDKCPKKLKTKVSLMYHMNTHSEFRNFCCHTCGKLFKTYTCMLNHFKIHEEQKKYKCIICDKEFRQSNHLAEHKKIHTGMVTIFIYSLHLFIYYAWRCSTIIVPDIERDVP